MRWITFGSLLEKGTFQCAKCYPGNSSARTLEKLQEPVHLLLFSPQKSASISHTHMHFLALRRISHVSLTLVKNTWIYKTTQYIVSLETLPKAENKKAIVLLLPIEKGDAPNLLFNSHILPALTSPYPSFLLPPSLFLLIQFMSRLGIPPGFPSGPGSVKALAVQDESSAGSTSLIRSDAKLSSSASSLLNYFPWENNSQADAC